MEQALTLLARYAPGARILAGGHSLIPMMKLRLAQPEVLIDINGIRGLRYIERVGGELRIGALARHADLLAAPLAGEHFTILHDAERVIADPIVRNWGTIGGSLCQADPSEDLSAAFAALKGSMIVHGPGGRREVSARAFHTGPYETVVGPAEMLTEIRLPIRPDSGSAYLKVARRAGDWPIGAAGAAVWLADGLITDVGIGLTAVGAARFRRGRGRGIPARPARRRADPRAGGRDRGRALPSGLRPARPGRVQAAPGAGAHRPGAAASPSAGPASWRREDHRDRQRNRLHAGGGTAAAAHSLPPRRAAADRLALGVRHVQLRCLRDLAGRDAGQVLHGARRHGGRAADRHRRGPGPRRRARPGAGGVRHLPRAAMRLLHARHADDRPLAARPQPRSDRRRGPRGDIRPGLPLHRVREHRQVGAVGRQARRRRRRRG